jgi:C1A family cysteine protease
LRLYGAPPDEYWPYNISKFDQVPAWDMGMLGQSFQVVNYFRLDKGVPADQSLVTRMKQYITSGFCLGIGFTVFSSYSQSNTNGGYFPYPQPTESVEGGHAVTLVGYDDAKEGGCFRLVNSWGTDWGSKGFGWIPYKYFTNNRDANGPLADDIWAILKLEYLDTGEFGFND